MRQIQYDVGNGIHLAADIGGDSSSPTVLLLHGGGQTRHSWKNAAERLVTAGYQAVSLDLRGHGESAWSTDQDYRLDVFVEDLRAVLDTLEQPATLVGASLGGLTSLLAIGEAGLAASGLVLVDVVPRIEAKGAAQIRSFMQSAPEGFANLEEAADAVAAYLPHRPRPTDLSGLQRNLRMNEHGRWRWHYDPAISTPDNRPSAQRAERLESAAANVRVPTLLIRGSASQVVSEEGARQLLTLIPHAQFVCVSGADHMVAGDANDAFNDALLEFLQGAVQI